MKKTPLLLSGLILFLAACAHLNSQDTAVSDTVAIAPAVSKPIMDPGERLIIKSDCMSCHHKEYSLIGPAYREIAARYPKTPEIVMALSGKIRNGNKGTWGSVPMPSHPKISLEDAGLMVRYILSIKE